MTDIADRPAATLAAEPAPPAVESPGRRILREFFASPVAVVALVVVVATALAAIFAPFIAPQDPYDLAALDIMDGTLAPGSATGAGFTAWLGTDEQGRDMWSGILYGLRLSLWVGFISTAIALVIGTTIGLVSAQIGGAVDAFIMRVVDLQLSFPAILIALILLAIFGKGVDKVIIALVAVQWAYYARTVRASALVERAKDYVEAARCLALPTSRILFRHILPNCMAPLIVVATVQVAHAIALEATLSFLGVGVPVTQPSLGLLIAKGYDFMLSGKYWISVYPGIALLIVIFAINLVGDRLRDITNPRLAR